MPERKVYHVTKNPKGGWSVKKEGGARAMANLPNKTEAVKKGKELAKKAPLGQLKIHKEDGTFQTEYTYGKDPKSSKG